jgi:phosphoglucomutase
MDRFADEAARTLAAAGVRALLSDAAVPTPTVSHAVITRKLAGAINFTASHNPPAYGGLKFSTHQGVPSPKPVTADIEARLAKIDSVPEPAADGKGVERVDLRAPYLSRIKELVKLDAIAAAGVKVAVDPLYGTTRGYLDTLLRDAGIPTETLHDTRDVLFGGRTPDCSEANLDALAAKVKEGSFTLGLATDGDGDRFAVIDEKGAFVSANLILALLADYLAESRGWKHGLGRTVATTHLLDAVAAERGMEVHETPVGFKYLGELLVAEKVYLGGEESAGMSILGHVPEKDGILADLLTLEMVAVRGKTLSEQKDDLFARLGALYSRRVDHRFEIERMEALRGALAAVEPRELDDRKVTRVDRRDGLKLVLEDGAWMLLRPSGTEPVVRQYFEAPSEIGLARLMEAGRRFLAEV